MQNQDQDPTTRYEKDFRPTLLVDGKLVVNMKLDAYDADWLDRMETASKNTGFNHPPYFRDVLSALKSHNVWAGPADRRSKSVAVLYARFGGIGMNGKDHGWYMDPQERYDTFLYTLAKARNGDISSIQNLKCCIVSWLRGYMDLRQDISFANNPGFS